MATTNTPFSFSNIPVPLATPLGMPITAGFLYRVLAFNANSRLEDVKQMYGHTLARAKYYSQLVQGKYTFVVVQIWDTRTGAYKMTLEVKS